MMYSLEASLRLVFQALNERLNICLLHARHVFLVVCALWVPLFVVLILSLHLVEVELESIGLLCSRSEMCLHAEVKAGLKAGASLRHIVIEVLVEVRQLLIVQLALLHAVLEDNTTGRLNVEAAIILLFRLREGGSELELLLW